MMRDTLLDIARAGVLAPSADNQHVFRIELAEDAIVLWPTSEFAEGTERHRRVLGLMSLGAVVENMRLRGGEIGVTAHARWFPSGDAGPIARLELRSDPDVHPDELAKAIPVRHTNRRMYRGPRLTDDETALLTAAAQPAEGVRLIWLQGDARRRALGLVWRAESERFLRRRLHEELFSSIRFDLSWQEVADRALSPGALEVEPPARPVFKALRNWKLMQPLTRLGMHRLLGMRAGWLPCWQAPALGLLTTSLPVEQGAVQAGATLERLWLRATLLGVALQPMAASAVLPLQSGIDGGASGELRSVLKSGWQSIAPGAEPLMVFRMGRASPPSLISGRQPLERYLINELA